MTGITTESTSFLETVAYTRLAVAPCSNRKFTVVILINFVIRYYFFKLHLCDYFKLSNTDRRWGLDKLL